jgi:hypothetical protein
MVSGFLRRKPEMASSAAGIVSSRFHRFDERPSVQVERWLVQVPFQTSG